MIHFFGCIGRWILCHWVPGKPFDIITFTLFSKIEIIVGTRYMLRDFSLRAVWVGYTGMWSLVKQWKVIHFPLFRPFSFPKCKLLSRLVKSIVVKRRDQPTSSSRKPLLPVLALINSYSLFLPHCQICSVPTFIGCFKNFISTLHF